MRVWGVHVGGEGGDGQVGAGISAGSVFVGGADGICVVGVGRGVSVGFNSRGGEFCRISTTKATGCALQWSTAGCNPLSLPGFGIPVGAVFGFKRKSIWIKGCNSRHPAASIFFE